MLRLLGKGKGGYSYLVTDGASQYVLKQIHHEPCEYYTFGDKLQSELRDYETLRKLGIPMPRLLAADYLKPDGVAVINDYEIASSSIAAGLCEYPDGCLEAMQQHFRCHVLKAGEIAEQLGNAKCMNIVLFGSMAKALGMDDIDWEAVIAETVPPKFRELNLRAYRAGHDAVQL